MGVKFANFAKSKLVAALSTTDTLVRISVGTGAKFPALPRSDDWFPLAVVDADGNVEIMRATSRVGDAITVVRGQEGTGPRTFPVDSALYLPQTAAALDEIAGLIPLASISDGVVGA